MIREIELFRFHPQGLGQDYHRGVLLLLSYICNVGLALPEAWTYPDQILLNFNSTLLYYRYELIRPKYMYVFARLFSRVKSWRSLGIFAIRCQQNL